MTKIRSCRRGMSSVLFPVRSMLFLTIQNIRASACGPARQLLLRPPKTVIRMWVRNRRTLRMKQQGATMGRYAYSPLGNTGLGRGDLPSGVKGSYEGYTYAYGADLTIYGGTLDITIDWAVDEEINADADTTGIEVMISDLIDSDGMGWTDADGDDDG